MTSALVIIVAYDCDPHLDACLASLDLGAQVFVLDNADSAATANLCERHGARYLGSPSNLGFAGGVNLAVTHQWDGQQDVLLLNPDALVTRADVTCLSKFLHERPDRAAVGPRLVGESGSAARADFPFPSPVQAWFEALGLSRWWRGRRFVIGAVLLIKGRALAELGGLDEGFFLYAEETDWQLRAVRSGWTVAVDRSVQATHIGGASSSDPARREAYFYRSAEIFARRWYGSRGWAIMRLAGVVAAARRATLSNKDGRVIARRTLVRFVRGPVRSADSVISHSQGGRHVVQVIRSDSFAGVERYVCDIAGELFRRGWKVTVIGGDRVQMRAELPVGVEHRVGNTSIEVAKALWQVRRSDVVHAHMTGAEFPAALFKNHLRARLVVTRHFAQRRGSTRRGRLAGWVIRRRVDAQVSVSEFVAATIGEASVTIPSGVTRSERTETRENTVVVMQRLEPEKNTDEAVRAWAASPLADLGWRLVIYGRGSQLEQLRELSHDLKCHESIEFGGYTTHPRIALARAAALLAPAPREPFGLSVVEAMAEATPVIASRGGAHMETLGSDGVFFDPGDVASCARVLARLAISDVDWTRRGERLRQRQRAQFSTERHVQALEHVFNA
ncbi:MAG: group 1 glycosyl transferase [Pseudonocardiales bacterium]|nr:group 1 glycosyl transferase [Pseudonocardiales bacterium]